MKNLTGFATIICFVLLFANAGCKKTDDTEPVNTDITNKVFRVHATTDVGTPFNITITQKSVNNTTNAIEVKQDNGGDFNYGFTPEAGSTITVKVQADKVIDCFVFYAGTNFGLIDMIPAPGGKYEGELVKTITQ